MSNTIKVEEFDPRPYLGKRLVAPHRRMLLSEGWELKGSFDIAAKNVNTGELEWSHTQDNLVTDVGRVYFAWTRWESMVFGFAPSRELPSIGRASLATDGSQCVVSANQGLGTVTALTYTRTFGPITFTAPASNRTLGTLFAGTVTYGVDANLGLICMLAYAPLSPSKVQTTVQTIELNYKLSISPIV